MKHTITITLFLGAVIVAAVATAAVRGALLTADDEPAPDLSLQPDAPESPTPPPAPPAEPREGEPPAEPEIIDLKNEKCPVMGGTAQENVYLDYEGVRVHFCCPGCDKTFQSDPAKYLRVLGIEDLDAFKRSGGREGRTSSEGPSSSSAASDQGVIDLENEKCPVMGGTAQENVYLDYEGVRVHFCCPGCDKTFQSDPAKYLRVLGIEDLDAFKRSRRGPGAGQ